MWYNVRSISFERQVIVRIGKLHKQGQLHTFAESSVRISPGHTSCLERKRTEGAVFAHRRRPLT